MTQADRPNDPDPAVAQASLASDYAKQALLGSGVQNVYFGERGQDAEAAISLAPPFGLRDDRLPVRGRDALLDELTTLGVHLVHGLGGSGKTRLALEVAHQAELEGTEVWWVLATEETGSSPRCARSAAVSASPTTNCGMATRRIWSGSDC